MSNYKVEAYTFLLPEETVEGMACPGQVRLAVKGLRPHLFDGAILPINYDFEKRGDLYVRDRTHDHNISFEGSDWKDSILIPMQGRTAPERNVLLSHRKRRGTNKTYPLSAFMINGAEDDLRNAFVGIYQRLDVLLDGFDFSNSTQTTPDIFHPAFNAIYKDVKKDEGSAPDLVTASFSFPMGLPFEPMRLRDAKRAYVKDHPGSRGNYKTLPSSRE